jgi:hypothetical protein
MTRAEELPNPGLTVTFIDRMEDVTDYVKRASKEIKSRIPMLFSFCHPLILTHCTERAGGELLSAQVSRWR